MLTATQIQDIVIRNGDLLFPLGMSQYISQTKRVIWGLLIVPEERKFHCLFGDIASADMEQFNSTFHDTEAGYRVRARDHFPRLTADADVFLISKQCLDFAPQEIEALIIHELCHWYIDSGLQSSHPIVIGATDNLEAKSLYGKTDQENELKTKHTLQFCELLCAVAARAVQVSSSFPSREALLASAMKFDIQGGFTV